MATFSTSNITGVKKMKVSTEKVWVNADKSKVAKEGSPEAAFLLVGEGGVISDEDAEKFGVKTTDAPEGPAPDNTAPHMYEHKDEDTKAPAAPEASAPKAAKKGAKKR